MATIHRDPLRSRSGGPGRIQDHGSLPPHDPEEGASGTSLAPSSPPAVLTAEAGPQGSVEAAAASMSDYGSGLDADDHLYRSLSGTKRDINPYIQNRSQELSYSLWKTNALAHRIIELEKDIIVGDGWSIETPDEELQRVLDEHWEHPQNRWDVFLEKYVREYAIFGEQLWPASVNPVTGQVWLGYVDPSKIKYVHKDPLNAKFEGEVVLKAPSPGEQEQHMQVVRTSLDPADPAYGRLAGETFFFRANSVIGATRGIPDLHSLVDWLDGYDQVLFDQLERAGFLNAWIWDVELKGFSQEQIDAWCKTHTAPRPGSDFVHNENVSRKPLSPSLNSADVSGSAKLLKNHVLGSRSLPEHFFAEGGDVNRATAAEMDFPTVKTLTSRQFEWKTILLMVARFVRDQAILHKEIRETDEGKIITVQAPEISDKDVQRIAGSFFQVVQSMALAREKGWATDDQAIKIVCRFSGQLGVDIAPEEVRELMDEVPTGEAVDYLEIASKERRKRAIQG